MTSGDFWGLLDSMAADRGDWKEAQGVSSGLGGRCTEAAAEDPSAGWGERAEGSAVGAGAAVTRDTPRPGTARGKTGSPVLRPGRGVAA